MSELTGIERDKKGDSVSKLNRAAIQAAAREELSSSANGIRWSDLVRAVHMRGPETPRNSVVGGLIDLIRKDPTIVKVARGMYILDAYLATSGFSSPETEEVLIDSSSGTSPASEAPREFEFYASFAEWLTHSAEEVNQAVALGGNVLKEKWGTPDVLGTRRPVTADFVKFDTQIVAAELKTDASQTIVAFGQAVAYRLFAHKSFLVVPRKIAKDEQDRLTALCTIHGLGLVLFDLDVDEPAYTMEVRAQLASPDYYYVNEVARKLHKSAPEVFATLF